MLLIKFIAKEKETLILTGSCNNLLNIFDYATGSKTPSLQFNKHTQNSRVSWSYYDPNLFISGSLDKNIFLWDIREKQPVVTFDRRNPVRHVQFSPHDESLFAAGYNDGAVRVWDIRKKSILHENSLHVQPSMSLDWHSTHKDLILSCGLDQTIKAWNLTTGNKVFHICTANTIAKAKWIPGSEFLISSIHKQSNSSLLNVWHGMKPNY